MPTHPPIVAVPASSAALPPDIIGRVLRQAGWDSRVMVLPANDGEPSAVERIATFVGEIARLRNEEALHRIEVQKARSAVDAAVGDALAAIEKDVVKPLRARVQLLEAQIETYDSACLCPDAHRAALAALRGVARFETVTGTCWCDAGEAGVSDPNFEHCPECLAARAAFLKEA